MIFPSSLRKECVILTNTEHSDFLNVFAVIKDLDLLIFTIIRDFFCYAAASEVDVIN